MSLHMDIIGGGALGAALACIVGNIDRKSLIWSRNEQVVSQINDHHSSPYLKDVTLPAYVHATNNLADMLDADALLIAIPTNALRTVLAALTQTGMKNDTTLVLCCKGIEKDTLLLPTEIVNDVLPHHQHVALMSGPNFAHEIAKGQIAATTLACADSVVAENLLHCLGGPTFRTYLSTDLIGAQLCGAVKNVLAIACGIARGRAMGENAIAMLVTRGIAEIARLVEAKGGDVKTVMGLSGIGDILLTCSSLSSRNTSLGYALGSGDRLDEAIAKQRGVTEGIHTAQSVYHMAEKLNVDMPICNSVYDILYEDEDIDEAVHHLLARPLGAE